MKLKILGSVQDGGVPHLGCECEVCEAARDDCRNEKFVASVLLKENAKDDSVRYMIDASPDIRRQIKGDYLDGVFVSHGDLGHIAGLLYFGHESANISSLPTYATEKTYEFLRKNDPYRLLLDRENLRVNEIEDGDEIDIQGGVIEVMEVEHSALSTDTIAFKIRGEEKTVYYLSDIDEWSPAVKEAIQEADIAIIDGTFWSRDEIDRYEEVPHPPIRETMDLMENYTTEIYFTHMNHTNPVLREDSEERKELEERGFGVVEEGTTFEI